VGTTSDPFQNAANYVVTCCQACIGGALERPDHEFSTLQPSHADHIVSHVDNDPHLERDRLNSADGMHLSIGLGLDDYGVPL
jgi:hypothetical protein